jgi:HK97 family phage major capsid protein
MYAAMHAGATAPVWLTNKNTFPQLLTLSIALGAISQPVFLPAGGISGKPFGTIFGDPVLSIEQAASIGDLGDLAYVDLGEYLWIEKGGIQSASSIHVNFLTDETAFRWIVRVNGQPMWDKALTPYKGVASSISPFVTLAAR